MVYLNKCDIACLVEGQEVWACAYQLDRSKMELSLMCKPKKGIIKGNRFIEFKKDGTLSKKKVYIYSRWYADTKEECIELYNSLVCDCISLFEKRIYELKNELIDKSIY